MYKTGQGHLTIWLKELINYLREGSLKTNWRRMEINYSR
jgi:hypothetical protein